MNKTLDSVGTSTSNSVTLKDGCADWIKPHINALIVKFFDEEEESMVSFFVETVRKFGKSEDAFKVMYEDMEGVLDDDCGEFMGEVWRLMKYFEGK